MTHGAGIGTVWQSIHSFSHVWWPEIVYIIILSVQSSMTLNVCIGYALHHYHCLTPYSATVIVVSSNNADNAAPVFQVGWMLHSNPLVAYTRGAAIQYTGN